MKKYLILWILLGLGSVMLTGKVAAQTEEEPQPPAAYRQLPDLHVFADTPYGQWVGSGDGLVIETGEYGTLPVDQTELFNELPSYRVSVSGASGWWSFLLAGKDWESYSIAPYYPDGVLEFNIKGNKGGENFDLALNDIAIGRNPENLSSGSVSMSNILPVTAEWQHVVIPLSALLPNSAGFNLDQLFSVVFSGVVIGEESQEMTFWLNDIRFTSPGVEASFPQVKLNQVGYTPLSRKVAYVSDFAEDFVAQAGTPFTVRDVANNQIVYQGELAWVTDYDTAVSGEKMLAADFSELETPGNYYLSVEAYRIEDSPVFAVGETIYQDVVRDTLRYYYLQRSGMPLEQAYAGQFARGAGHMQDAQAQFRSGSQSPKDVSGGWYDAGDYGKYVNAGATAVSDLLWAFELFPDQFADGQLNIPESGNGVPDLLDEVRWELDWMLKMQDPQSGGFYHMVQPTEKTAVPNAHETRYIEDTDGSRENVRPTSTTASAVAALAHGAKLFESVDPDFANELLLAAEAGWVYLQENPDGVASVPGPYADDEDSDERFWAAAALYRATGSAEYHDYLKSVYRDVETFFESETDNAYGVGRMEMIAWLTYAHSDERDPDMMAYFVTLFEGWSARMVDRWQASNWDIALADDDFYWGSNYVALTTPLVMLVGSQALGEMDETAVAMSQAALDYILGNNPLSFSYVTGYGENSVQNPFSNQWSYDTVATAPDGVFVAGPNAYSNPLLYSNFAGKRYIDSAANWTTNEHTIYWNSALVFHAALANQRSQSGTAPVIMPTFETAVVAEPALASTPAASAASDASALGDPAALNQSVAAPQPDQNAASATDNTLKNLMIGLSVIGVVLILVVMVCTAIIVRALKHSGSSRM